MIRASNRLCGDMGKVKDRSDNLKPDSQKTHGREQEIIPSKGENDEKN
jgi:hypothetical protein